MNFYTDLDGDGEQCIWTDNPLSPDAPICLVRKLTVPMGHWDEVVHRLTHDPRRDALERLTMDTEYHEISSELDQVRSELIQAQDEIERLMGELAQARYAADGAV